MFHLPSKWLVKLSAIMLIVGLLVPLVSAAGDGYYWNWAKSVVAFTATCNLSGSSYTLYSARNVPSQGGTLVETQYLNGASLGTTSGTVPGGHSGGNVPMAASYTAISYPYTFTRVHDLRVQAGQFTYLTSRSTITLTCAGPGSATVNITNTDY